MALRLPLHDLHEHAGARFAEADGHLLPLHYGDPVAEHRAVRGRVGLIDRSQRGKIEATGRDRAAFLHALLSNDVTGLAPGQGRAATLLDAHGKVLALLVVHCLADRLVLETDGALAGPLAAALDGYLFSERVELTDATAESGVLTLAGPTARVTVEKLVGQAIPDLPDWHHAVVPAEGAGVRVVRTGESGEEGYDLWAPTAALGPLWERAVAGGARPVGRDAWNILRVEAGVVWYGADLDGSTLLMESPLDHAYALDKGCYVGQEVVARVTYRGHVNRKIVGFVFADARVPPRGAEVRVEGRAVGRITSAVVSPGLGRALALGFLRREHWAPGTGVEVGGDGEPLRAEVVALPFHRPAPEAQR